jgi:hypothetical protein
MRRADKTELEFGLLMVLIVALLVDFAIKAVLALLHVPRG